MDLQALRDHLTQRIVYKLVPHLLTDELQRRRAFLKTTSFDGNDAVTSLNSRCTLPRDSQAMTGLFADSDDVSICIQLIGESSSSEESSCKELFQRRYLLCPATTTITLVKRFIQSKFGLYGDKHVVEMFHKGELLEDEDTLLDVAYAFDWDKSEPLMLDYVIVTCSSCSTPEIADVEFATATSSCPKRSSMLHLDGVGGSFSAARCRSGERATEPDNAVQPETTNKPELGDEEVKDVGDEVKSAKRLIEQDKKAAETDNNSSRRKKSKRSRARRSTRDRKVSDSRRSARCSSKKRKSKDSQTTRHSNRKSLATPSPEAVKTAESCDVEVQPTILAAKQQQQQQQPSALPTPTPSATLPPPVPVTSSVSTASASTSSSSQSAGCSDDDNCLSISTSVTVVISRRASGQAAASNSSATTGSDVTVESAGAIADGGRQYVVNTKLPKVSITTSTDIQQPIANAAATSGAGELTMMTSSTQSDSGDATVTSRDEAVKKTSPIDALKQRGTTQKRKSLESVIKALKPTAVVSATSIVTDSRPVTSQSNVSTPPSSSSTPLKSVDEPSTSPLPDNQPPKPEVGGSDCHVMDLSSTKSREDHSPRTKRRCSHGDDAASWRPTVLPYVSSFGGAVFAANRFGPLPADPTQCRVCLEKVSLSAFRCVLPTSTLNSYHRYTNNNGYDAPLELTNKTTSNRK